MQEAIYMKIRPFKKGDEVETSDVIRDSLENHKYDFQGIDPKLIEHDISVYTPRYVEDMAEQYYVFVGIDQKTNKVLGVACLKDRELMNLHVHLHHIHCRPTRSYIFVHPYCLCENTHVVYLLPTYMLILHDLLS